MLKSIALLCVSAAFALAAAEPPKLRLAEVEKIQPLSYRADLTVDPEKDDFSGVIDIQTKIDEPLSTIWLNQEKLTVQEASLKSGGKTYSAQAIPGGDDFLGLQFDQPIPAGPASIHIVYTGLVSSKNTAGIFRQKDLGNWYLYTQFEATDARAAFPCFDEPSYKTPWQLTLHIPSQDTAISNTNPGSEKTAGATKTVVFHQTPPLPSYLVAFGVGPFEYVSGGKAGSKQVPVRIVVPKGRSAEAKYAAQVTAEIISRHEKYFGIPFPYEKADQVAIPDTAGFGAMENPGMVTYALNIILAKPESDTINRQRDYAETAAHELAHQWFGDLVTTAWWNDIWLNEAFATWMEQKMIAEWKPEWKTNVDDVVGQKLYAEGQDSLVSARKIRQPIETRDDISNAFDGITYQKGAAVIGMFENWIGAKDFQKGVQSYMKQYAFQATTSGQFLDAIGSATKKDAAKAFSTFLNQAGVPLISLALQCGQEPELHMEQSRSLPLGSKGSANQVWSIPVCVRYGTGVAGETECTLMTEASMDWKLKAKSCPAWVESNDRAIGYYRTDYQGGLLAALTAGDVEKRLSAPERVDLMGNAKALASAGKLQAGDALSLVATFHNDPERQVLESAVGLALGPQSYLVPDSLKPNYERFILKNFQAKAHELGWTPKPGEPDEVKLLRPSLVSIVATAGGDRELASQAQSLAAKWLDDHHSLDPNLVGAVLRTAAYYGDKSLFDRLLDQFPKTQDKQVRAQLVGAMGAFRDPAAIRAGMDALLAGKVPFIEGIFLLFNGQSQADTRKIPFEFLQANWDAVVAKMPSGGGFDYGAVLPQVGASFCDPQSKQELQDYFKPRVSKFVGAPRTLDQVLENVDLCIARTAAQRPSVEAFLSKY
jgi:alanyl aminopeptidase